MPLRKQTITMQIKEVMPESYEKFDTLIIQLKVWHKRARALFEIITISYYPFNTYII